MAAVVDRAADDVRPALTSTSPGTVSRRLAAGGRGRRKLSTCRAAVVSSGATISSVKRCSPVPSTNNKSRPAASRPIARVAVVEPGALQADAAEVQRQGVQAVFQDVDRQRAADFAPVAARPRPCSRPRRRRPAAGRGFPAPVWPASPGRRIPRAQQHPLRLLFQQDVQVGEGNVDFAGFLLGAARRRLSAEAMLAGAPKPTEGLRSARIAKCKLQNANCKCCHGRPPYP